MCINPKCVRGSDLQKLQIRLVLRLLKCHSRHPAHLGSCLSCDILVSLYHHVLNIDPARYRAAGRDIFILSKGHAAMGLYAVLAKEDFSPRNSQHLQY